MTTKNTLIKSILCSVDKKEYKTIDFLERLSLFHLDK